MKFTVPAKARRRPLLTLFVLAFVTTLVAVPSLFRSGATTRSTGEGLFQRTVSEREDLPNYDIRSDKTAVDRIAAFRSSLSRSAVQIADIRDEFTRGEATLATRVPTLKVEYNTDIRTPEVITPDVWRAKVEWLTPPADGKRSEILRSFVKQYNSLTGVTDEQADALKVTADYTNAFVQGPGFAALEGAARA